MKNAVALSVLLFVLNPAHSFACVRSSDSSHLFIKSFFANNLNPGASVGTGGCRAYYFTPLIRLKTGLLTTSFNRFNINGKSFGGFQFDLDLFRIHKKSERYRDVVQIGTAITGYTQENDPVSHYYRMLLIGVARYQLFSRFSYSAKIGFRSIETIYSSVSEQLSYFKNQPYGEFSIGYNLFKFQPKTKIR
ncbi:MAG: hypothetical protein GC181_09095 [Bacteroidetes bacterium]|nr:hypothetical protein [Bacteroidota bacterium]